MTIELPVVSLPVVSLSNTASDQSTGCGSAGSATIFEPSRRLPDWLRREVPKGNANHLTSSILSELRLETVCENAKCPNRMECYSQQTATFMILGNVCTRPCGFCSVPKGKTEALQIDEPARVAEAARRMGLTVMEPRVLESAAQGRGIEQGFLDWDGNVIVLYQFPTADAPSVR